MSTSNPKYKKNLKVTPSSKQALERATVARFGTKSVPWSHVIQTWAEEEIERQEGDTNE